MHRRDRVRHPALAEFVAALDAGDAVEEQRKLRDSSVLRARWVELLASRCYKRGTNRLSLLILVAATVIATPAAAHALGPRAPRTVTIDRACKGGSVAARIGGARVCLRVGLKCKARYERAYAKKGFKCVNGRLRKTSPPPPPPPPPTALEGRYQFLTSQCPLGPPACNIGTLTVLPGGLTFTNFTAPYFADCVPPFNYVDILSTKQDVPLYMDPGTLKFEISGTFPVPGGTASGTANGQFDTAGNVSGSFDVHISGNDSAGTHHECDSGQVNFSGKLQSSG